MLISGSSPHRWAKKCFKEHSNSSIDSGVLSCDVLATAENSRSGTAKERTSSGKQQQSNFWFDLKRSLTAILVALSAAGTAASPSLALSTNETVEHAAILKSAPPCTELPTVLETKGKNSPYYGNRLQWNSANPNDAFLLCIHAWGLSAREFSSFGKEMSNRGFDSEAMDVRGFGLNRNQEGMKIINLRQATKDIGQMLADKRKTDPKKKLFLIGESMGGAMALKVAATYPELVDGVVCSAPAWRIFSLKSITVKGIADQVFGEPGLAAKSITHMASSDEKLQNQWLSDSVYRMNYSAPEALGYWKLMRSTPKNAESIKGIPILVVQGLNDHLSKPEASVKLFSRLKNKNKQLAIVLNGEHLVLEENQLKPVVASYVQDWVLNQMRDHAHAEASPQMVAVGDPAEITAVESKELERLKKIAGVKPLPQTRTTASIKRDPVAQ
jgi:acylglycerol lipase